jgi:hypothetical protein
LESGNSRRVTWILEDSGGFSDGFGEFYKKNWILRILIKKRSKFTQKIPWKIASFFETQDAILKLGNLNFCR